MIRGDTIVQKIFWRNDEKFKIINICLIFQKKLLFLLYILTELGKKCIGLKKVLYDVMYLKLKFFTNQCVTQK